MKKLVGLCLLGLFGLAPGASAQFTGGDADGYDSATSALLNFPGFVNFYAGGIGDGYDSAASGLLNFPGFVNFYAGGSGDGFGQASHSAAALPVELVAFAAQADGEQVRLSWQTASETNNAGFAVERRGAEETREGGEAAWAQVGFVAGQGTTSQAQRYQFADEALPFGAQRLVYRLKQIDFDGAFAYSPEVEVDLAAPTHFRLHENYPNPFNPETVIRYEVPTSGPVRLTVYDALGREVRLLVAGEQAAGRYEAVFAATGLASGLYVYRLEAGGHVAERTMLLLK